jgi:hypothetical protein
MHDPQLCVKPTVHVLLRGPGPMPVRRVHRQREHCLDLLLLPGLLAHRFAIVRPQYRAPTTAWDVCYTARVYNGAVYYRYY